MLKILILFIILSINTLSDLNQSKGLENPISLEIQQDIDYLEKFKLIQIVNIPSAGIKYQFLRFYKGMAYYRLVFEYYGDKEKALIKLESMKNSTKSYAEANDLEFIEID